MSRTYHNKRSFTISGKAGKLPIKLEYNDPEASLALHIYKQKKKLAVTRKKDRQWKLAAAAAANPRLLIGGAL